MKKNFESIVVKIGTNVITQTNGLLDIKVLKNFIGQIAQLKKKGVDIIVVTSGAMGCGKSLIKLKEDSSDVIKRQTLASIGQVKLMATYLELFRKKGFVCAQVLVTKEDFRDRSHYVNMQNCFLNLLCNNVIPVVNENDVISIDELMFTDNDELAGLIATMAGADALIILTDVEGVYDRNPILKNAKLISEVNPNDSVQKFIGASKSSFGRGGMRTKTHITEKLSKLGITSFIANGKKRGILLDIFAEKKAGTKFWPTQCKIRSGVKRWIAVNAGREKGTIVVDDGVEKILRERIASLLPIGVLRLEGDFHKGDMVKIQNRQGKDLGCGIAAHSAKTAKFSLGRKGEKPLIHYNYLFLY